MICIIAESRRKATRWAEGQMLREDEWFYPDERNDLLTRKDFHVIVIDPGDMPNNFLNELLTLAWRRGRMK